MTHQLIDDVPDRLPVECQYTALELARLANAVHYILHLPSTPVHEHHLLTTAYDNLIRSSENMALYR